MSIVDPTTIGTCNAGKSLKLNFSLPGPFNLFRGELKRPKKKYVFSLWTDAKNDEDQKEGLTFELLVLPPPEGGDVMHCAHTRKNKARPS